MLFRRPPWATESVPLMVLSWAWRTTSVDRALGEVPWGLDTTPFLSVFRLYLLFSQVCYIILWSQIWAVPCALLPLSIFLDYKIQSQGLFSSPQVERHRLAKVRLYSSHIFVGLSVENVWNDEEKSSLGIGACEGAEAPSHRGWCGLEEPNPQQCCPLPAGIVSGVLPPRPCLRKAVPGKLLRNNSSSSGVLVGGRLCGSD